MTILHLSDTHSQHRRLTQLPDADILVHSGDFTECALPVQFRCDNSWR